MVWVMEEIILTCLILTGSVQISDNVTVVCTSPSEQIEEVPSSVEEVQALPFEEGQAIPEAEGQAE